MTASVGATFRIFHAGLLKFPAFQPFFQTRQDAFLLAVRCILPCWSRGWSRGRSLASVSERLAMVSPPPSPTPPERTAEEQRYLCLTPQEFSLSSKLGIKFSFGLE